MIKKLNSEIRQAMSDKNSFRRDVLRMMKSQLEEESKKKKSRQDIDVIQAYKKKLQKATEIKGIPEDFILKTNKEVDIIDEFLPREITMDEAINIGKASKLTTKQDLIAHIKAKSKELEYICPGRIAFLAAMEVLNAS